MPDAVARTLGFNGAIDGVIGVAAVFRTLLVGTVGTWAVSSVTSVQFMVVDGEVKRCSNWFKSGFIIFHWHCYYMFLPSLLSLAVHPENRRWRGALLTWGLTKMHSSSHTENMSGDRATFGIPKFDPYSSGFVQSWWFQTFCMFP